MTRNILDTCTVRHLLTPCPRLHAKWWRCPSRPCASPRDHARRVAVRPGPSTLSHGAAQRSRQVLAPCRCLALGCSCGRGLRARPRSCPARGQGARARGSADRHPRAEHRGRPGDERSGRWAALGPGGRGLDRGFMNGEGRCSVPFGPQNRYMISLLITMRKNG